MESVTPNSPLQLSQMRLSKSEPVLTDASEHEVPIQFQDHEKEVCEDYTVSNITQIMRPLD